MPLKPVIFKSRYSRRMPDPVLATGARHVFMLRAKDVPDNIPLDPNPRDQNTDRRVYRDVLESLTSGDGAFHLKNKGITIIASDVIRSKNDEEQFAIMFDDNEGIVDGGHTYAVLREGQSREDLPDNQFVKFEVLVGVPENLITEIAGGLNTAVQVQEMSLANLGGEFNWIKAALSTEPYASAIAYKENESDRVLDIRDVVAYMNLFNIDIYPNAGRDYPITAYTSKATSLRHFLDKEKAISFRKLQNLLPDILELADIISFEAYTLHNDAGGKAGKLSFTESSTKLYKFPFINESAKYRLTKGALFPMLGAFRWMVVEGPNGQFEWREPFDQVKELWRDTGAELMRATQATSDELGRNPNAIGKSRNHWSNLHATVAKYQLMDAAGS